MNQYQMVMPNSSKLLLLLLLLLLLYTYLFPPSKMSSL